MVNEQGQWTSPYVPVGLNMAAFGVFGSEENEKDRVKIEPNSPFLSTTEGKPLFDGKDESAFLKDMRAQLETVIDASMQTSTFIESLVNRNLICEFGLTIESLENSDGKPKIIKGLYTINSDEFPYLAAEDVQMFHEMGYWGPIYAIKHSMNQFKKLVQLHNEKHSSEKIKLNVHVDRETE